MSNLKNVRVNFKEKKLFEMAKENCSGDAVNKEKKTVRTTKTTSVHLDVIKRHRIQSDTGVLPPEKKVRFSANKIGTEVTPIGSRPPLADLDRNIKKNNVERSKIPVLRILHESKSTKNILRETSESTKVIKKYESEANSYKSERIRNYRATLCSLPTAKNQEVNCTTITNNTGEMIITEHYQVDKRKVIISRTLTPHPQYNANNSGSPEVFVDTISHPEFTYGVQTNEKKTAIIRPLTNNKSMSPIMPNIYTAKSVVICQGIPEVIKRPGIKTSLTHKQSIGARKLKSDRFSLDIYNTEYLQDVVQYQLRNDWKFVVRKNSIKYKNPCTYTRAAVINWLIQAQEYLDQPPSVLLTTVRLFDLLLASVSVPGNMYQLTGFVIMWIISKFEDTVNTLTASKMITLCKNAYSVEQFLKMEKKLLGFFCFDFNISDVTLYAMYYIRSLTPDVEVLLNIVHYILECYTLHLDCSTVIPSVQAAAAVCLAVEVINPNKGVWKRLENTLGYYRREELEDVVHTMLEQIQKVQDPNYKFRQAYKKYATVEKSQASIILLSKLVAT